MLSPVAEITPLDSSSAVADASHSNINTGACNSDGAAHQFPSPGEGESLKAQAFEVKTQPPATESARITPAPTFKPAVNTGASSAQTGAGQLHPSGAKASPTQLSEAKSTSDTRSSIPKAATSQSSHAETESDLSESIKTFATKDVR
jgi:hypothetical protein